MGQYYKAVNIDKRQYMLFDGAKLMEFAWKDNRSVHAFMGLMAGDWRGDRVFVVGDYADCERQDAADGAWISVYKGIVRELGIEGYFQYGDEYRLFQHAEDSFERVMDADEKLAKTGAKMRYIINEAQGVYIDLQHLPADTSEPWKDGVDVWCVHPLPLLLAMGNGRGGARSKTILSVLPLALRRALWLVRGRLRAPASALPRRAKRASCAG